MKKVIRVLIAKPGLDGHDAGAKVIVLGLRDAGFEVIYTGLRQMPENIAEVALQESVDVVGLSCLSGAHKTLFPKVVSEIVKRGCENMLVIGGGNIPQEDVTFLQNHGVIRVFTQGSTIAQIASYIKEQVKA